MRVPPGPTEDVQLAQRFKILDMGGNSHSCGQPHRQALAGIDGADNGTRTAPAIAHLPMRLECLGKGRSIFYRTPMSWDITLSR